MSDVSDDRLHEISHDLACGDSLDACCTRSEAAALIAEVIRRRTTPAVVVEVQAPAAAALHDYIRGRL